MSLFNELRRRNVLGAAAAYAVTAWLIIQIVETIFPAFGFGDAAVRIVVIVLAICFVPALILAWAFDLTPRGLVKDSEVDRDSADITTWLKRMDRLIMAGLALAIVYFAIAKFALAPREVAEEVEAAHLQGRTGARLESYGDQSIAVLSFRDMSPAGDQEYLSEGIAEELLNLLSRIPELRVISRSSAFSYKDKDL